MRERGLKSDRLLSQVLFCFAETSCVVEERAKSVGDEAYYGQWIVFVLEENYAHTESEDK